MTTNTPMRRSDTLRLLGEHREDLARLGVESLAVFGSVARDEAGPDSDVDVLVEVRRPMGLFGLIEIQEYLEGLLGRRVDLVTRQALKPRLRERVLREAVAVFVTNPAPR